MADSKNDYSFLNNIDNKVLIAMILLSSGLTLFAIVLNVMTTKDCTVTKYVYCDPEPNHGQGGHGAPGHGH